MRGIIYAPRRKERERIDVVYRGLAIASFLHYSCARGVIAAKGISRDRCRFSWQSYAWVIKERGGESVGPSVMPLAGARRRLSRDHLDCLGTIFRVGVRKVGKVPLISTATREEPPKPKTNLRAHVNVSHTTLFVVFCGRSVSENALFWTAADTLNGLCQTG